MELFTLFPKLGQSQWGNKLATAARPKRLQLFLAKSKVSLLVRDAENASAKFLMYFRQVFHTLAQTRSHTQTGNLN